MTSNTATINRPTRQTMADWQIGDLGLAVLTLTRELWVVKDRMRILEAVLEEHGIDAHQAIERYQPDEALSAELAKEGEALAERIVSSLAGDAP